MRYHFWTKIESFISHIPILMLKNWKFSGTALKVVLKMEDTRLRKMLGGLQPLNMGLIPNKRQTNTVKHSANFNSDKNNSFLESYNVWRWRSYSSQKWFRYMHQDHYNLQSTDWWFTMRLRTPWIIISLISLV